MLLAINWFNTTVITLLGFSVVFIVLILLIFILMGFGAAMQPKVKATTSVADRKTSEVKTEFKEVNLKANETAAIAMALHLYYNDLHDEEPTDIHIKHVTRMDTPWNSKMYGINNLHR